MQVVNEVRPSRKSSKKIEDILKYDIVLKSLQIRNPAFY